MFAPKHIIVIPDGLSIPCFTLGEWLISLTSEWSRARLSLEWLDQIQKTVKPDRRLDSEEVNLEQGTPNDINDNVCEHKAV